MRVWACPSSFSSLPPVKAMRRPPGEGATSAAWEILPNAGPRTRWK
jgi:hypothetical protein